MILENENEPVRYIGRHIANHDYHHGQLRPAIGTHHIQVVRANRAHPELVEGFGWTYNHAPMLAYWNNRFYLEYLSTPVNEHEPPGHTLLTTSPDGIHWEQPQVAFARYRIPNGVYHAPPDAPLAADSYAVMHQRMGFYVAPNDRMLLLAFYGVCPKPQVWPNDGRGIGRIVREIYRDGSLGDVYFLRLNRHAGWHEGNIRYPMYTTSADDGFIAACDALLADRLATLQWWEEDRSPDGFYAVEGHKALSYYHLDDGRTVGLWKWSVAAISDDDGGTWSDIAAVPSLVHAGAKIWGQRTSDGRFALVYNPTFDNKLRWPLAVVSSDDGLNFDNMLLVNGEVPPRRYYGYLKDYGQNYVRGICEGNGTPPDGGMWLTYSMNKEDIWVTRVPIPLQSVAIQHVNDDFNALGVDKFIPNWNIYSPAWARVKVVPFPSEADKSLMLSDQDPCDYARAERVFPESQQITITFKLMAAQNSGGELLIDLVDRQGTSPVRIKLDGEGQIQARYHKPHHEVGTYSAEKWHTFTIHADTQRSRFDLLVDDELLVGNGLFVKKVASLERIIFRTDRRRWWPTSETEIVEIDDIGYGEEAVELRRYYLNYLRTQPHTA